MLYESIIREIIRNNIQNDAIINYDNDASLKNIGLNSVLFIKTIVEIEKTFGIEFPNDKLVLEQADKIKILCEIVKNIKGSDNSL